MKKLIVICTLLLIGKTSFGQVMESTIVVDSLSRSALLVQVDASDDDVKDALEAYFKQFNIEKEKGKGFIIRKALPFITYKRAVVDSMKGQALDYYFKVDTRKQKGPDGANIYIAASSGYNNFINQQQEELWSNFKKFAEFLRSNYLEQHRLNNDITAITKEISKANNKLKDLEEEKQKLEKTIADKNSALATMQAQLSKLKTGAGSSNK